MTMAFVCWHGVSGVLFPCAAALEAIEGQVDDANASEVRKNVL